MRDVRAAEVTVYLQTESVYVEPSPKSLLSIHLPKAFVTAFLLPSLKRCILPSLIRKAPWSHTKHVFLKAINP